MKKSDLHREWARVLDMCEGTKVNPLDCWKVRGVQYMVKPQFNADTSDYEFAFAILEDKPVFVGDRVYRKTSGNEQVVFDAVGLNKVDWSLYTLNTPKKTFALNGDELPCPVKSMPAGDTYSMNFGDLRLHYFNCKEDRDKVLCALHKLLIDNTR